MEEIARISLKTLDRREKIGLPICMCVIVVAFSALEGWFGLRVGLSSVKEELIFCGFILGGSIIIVILHEGLHGVVFWIYTKRVKFGVKFDKVFWFVPYATSPGYKLQRGQLVNVGLAPQIVTVVMLVVSLSISPGWLLPRLLFWMAVLNFVGGAMDIYTVIWLFKFKQKILIEDKIDEAIIYEVPV